MEEDINIIEEFIEDSEIYEVYHTSRADAITKAMQNILARFKELEEGSVPKSVIRDKIDNRRMKLGKYRTYYYKDDYGLMISVNSEIQIELELLLEELLGGWIE